MRAFRSRSLELTTRFTLCTCIGLALATVHAKAKPNPSAQAAKPHAAAARGKAASSAAGGDEACGQIIVIGYRGAAHAKPDISRDKVAAAARAAELLRKIDAGADFAELARSESDAPSSAPRGGVMGTFRKSEWPELHAALRDPLFGLDVGKVARAPIAADYGYVLLRRCPVEKAHARHILVRYQGSKRSDASVTRTHEQAKAVAQELLKRLKAGADFTELARKNSEDASATRGGDIGTQGRGLLALPFEQALFALKPGQLSDVVETEFGFHIIQRLPD
jgi:peptidyl-prolyl cis-trans isomerase SurA